MKLVLAIKMKGGLGNQLFQYAIGRALCIQKKIPFLLFDIENYTNESLDRKFLLSKFEIKGSVIKNKHLRNLFSSGARLNNTAKKIKLHRHVDEKGFILKDISKNVSILTTLSGYWQSELYFKSIRSVLINELVPFNTPPFPGWIKKKDTVAVHVRRTDYLTEKRYGFIGKSYYTNALQYFKEKIHGPAFIFFSDDIAWCKAEFANEDCVFFEDIEWSADYLQLFLMSKCNHQVIANSSFSWWAAWLNQNPDKIVLRPAKPFVDQQLLHESHYPQEWIICNNN